MYLSGTKDITLDSTSLQALGENVRYSATKPAKLGAQLSLDLCRLFDIIIALSVLIFIAPLMLAVAMMIRAQDGGPALFRQCRIGEGGKTFKCLKFRTMVIDAEVRLNALLARDP